MANRPVSVTPALQASVDVVLIGVDEGAGRDGGRDDRPDGLLLHIGRHPQHDLTATLNQPQDRRLLLRQRAPAGCALEPTPAPIAPGFAETSCITATEALACGLPWISTDRGALPETLRDAGVLVSLADASHAAEPQIVERRASERWG